MLLVLALEVEHFKILGGWSGMWQTFKKSSSVLTFLEATLVLALIGLLVLLVLRKVIANNRSVFSFSKKKTRSEYEAETRKESQKQIESLVNSAAYSQHRKNFSTSSDFVAARQMDSDDEIDENDFSASLSQPQFIADSDQ